MAAFPPWPNTRLQRTRFAALRSPLSRKPFGGSLMFVTSCVIGLVPSTSLASGGGRSLAREVQATAKQLGCSISVTNPEVIGPAMAFGFLPGSPKDSAVFWCQRPDNLTLVIWQSAKSRKAQPFGCTNELAMAWSPGELSVGAISNVNLRQFGFLSMRDALEAPDVKVRDARTITVMNDAVSDIFVCHAGDWYFQHVD